MSLLAPEFQFSQSSLQDYVDCARRFELRYLQRVQYPAAEAEPIIEHERHMEMGELFHQLVHQHLIGLPEEKLTDAIQDKTVQRWWQNYLRYGLDGLPDERRPEIKLFTAIGRHRLVAQYDLLAFAPGDTFVIVDWKTASKRPTRDRLLQRLQTIVYRYVLVEAGAYLNGGVPIEPEQVEMVYWFPEYPLQPEPFSYDQAQHQAAYDTISLLVREIAARSVFELTQNTMHCRFCTYRSLCERGVEAGNLSEYENVEVEAIPFTFDFDQIAEVEF